MTRSARHALVHLALIAMILRGFLPTGWMPSPAGDSHAALVLCTMDGAVPLADGHGQHHQAPDDPQRGHDQCPFAGAPHLAPPANLAVFVLPASFSELAHSPRAPPAADAARLYPPQSPRAPPLNV